MCRRPLPGAFTLLLACVLVATPLAAQDRADERARLRARIDSLLPVRDSLEAVIDSIRHARLATPITDGLDTQRVGPLLVVTRPQASDAARDATERALASFGPVVDAAAAHLDSTVLLVEYRGSTPAFDAMRQRPGHRRVWLPFWKPASWHADLVAYQLAAVLGAALPVELNNWLGGQGIPAGGVAALEGAYRDLMTNASPAAIDCRAGDVARCADALGLGDPGARWERWYTSEQLADIALRQASFRASTRALRETCERERSAQACAAYLAEGGKPPVPLDVSTRRTLAAHVLALGGADAWRSLSSDSAGSIQDRLAGAAGLPADSLLASWRSAVLAARPPHAAGLGGTGLITLFWVLVAAAIAARSTRWRLG